MEKITGSCILLSPPQENTFYAFGKQYFVLFQFQSFLMRPFWFSGSEIDVFQFVDQQKWEKEMVILKTCGKFSVLTVDGCPMLDAGNK